MSASRDQLLALFAQDLMHWRACMPEAQHYGERLHRLNREDPELFVFRIDNAEVQLLDKPEPSALSDGLRASRAVHYLGFLREVVARYLPRLRLELGLNLGDCARGDAEIPLLSFQKEVGDQLLLLPDIDFLLFRFYGAPELMDNFEPERKLDRAVFVGSTTGVDPVTGKGVSHTLESIGQELTPRLRAARYFHQHADVLFHLPTIVQCATPEAQAHLRSLPYCGGDPVTWSEQYACRYLLSMDGNGATCSRVALALRSNSLLLKYRSNALLHYFPALVPWVHYVPVADEAGVEAALGLGRAHPELYASMVRNAQEFHDRYLGRPALMRYTALVLQELAALLGEQDEPGDALTGTSSAPLMCEAHIGDVGDVIGARIHARVGEAGSGRAIEAFRVWADHPTLGDRQLACQAMDAEDRCGPWVRGGMEVGSRGEQRPLAGLRLGTCAPDVRLRYRATFVGGFACDWVEAPGWCFHPSRAPLESFEIHM